MTADLHDIVVFILFAVGSIFFWLFLTTLEKEKGIFSKYIEELRDEERPFVSGIDNSKSYQEERKVMWKGYVFLLLAVLCYVLMVIV